MRVLRFHIALSLAALGLAAGCFKPDYASPGFYCHPEDNPACPDGQACIGGRCIGGGDAGTNSGNGIVPKTSSYTGVHMDPGLAIDPSMCSDYPLEPNNDIAHAVPSVVEQLMVVPDKGGGTLGTAAKPLAICPSGSKDVDYYQIDVPQSVTLVVDILYDIKYGDLDVGIFGPDGSLVQGDGSAVSNGCVAAPVTTGTYFVGVGGANDVDVNRYTMRVRFYTQPTTCQSTAPMDMGF
jgi:hypothetical protein